jgi:GT2 family glycosyltransferase
MQTPSVAVVILNWNGRDFLQKFLPSVTASASAQVQDIVHKRIIVADNASTDDSLSFVRQHYPEITIIQNNSNEGFAKGYNTALKQVVADYYVLLNSDVEVTQNWIEPVIALMESDIAIAACQPKILAYDKKDQFEYAGSSGGWLDKFGYPFLRGRVFDDCETDTGQYDDVQPCFWASGAAFFVRSAVYHELQGLDEFFFAHQEEIDFCWRAQLAGYKIYVQPASVVYHVGGGTLPRGNSRKAFLNFRNNLIMLAKNLTVEAAIWKIPFRMMLDVLSACRGLLSGDGGYFLAIAKAHFHFIGWLLSGKKQSVFPVKKSGKLHGWYNGSVVWAYFIQKKKTFSEIIGSK